MSHALDGSWEKVKRANQHINDLALEVDRFLQGHPYGVLTEDDFETGELLFCLRVWADPPVHLTLIAGDALHNLRCALDHLAMQLVVAGGAKPTRRTEFPIFDSKDKFEARLQGRLAGAPQDAIELVKATKPYKGGNDDLWLLHSLDIIDKHRLLITIGMSLRWIDIIQRDSHNKITMASSVLPQEPERKFPLKDGTILFRVPSGSQSISEHPDFEFSFEIALGENEIANGCSLVPTLRQLSKTVTDLLDRFSSLFP